MNKALLFFAIFLLPVLAVAQDRVLFGREMKSMSITDTKTGKVRTMLFGDKYDIYNFKHVPASGKYIDTTAQTIYRGTSKVTIFYDGHLVTSYVIPTPKK